MIYSTSRSVRFLVFSTFAAAALIVCASVGPAGAQSDPSSGAMASVKSVIDQAIAVFKDKQVAPKDREEKLRSIAESHFDFQEMARSAVGYHWRNFTPVQRSEFVPLFTAFIEDAYLARMESYSVEKVDQKIQSSAIQFTRETHDGDYAQVFSTVSLHDRPNPVQVNYQMRRDGSEWKIYDITVDAISVIANYRNQFNRVLNGNGYDKLVSIMRQKQQALGASLEK